MFQDWWQGIVVFFQANGVDIIVRVIGAILLLVVGHYFLKLVKKVLRAIFKVRSKTVDKSVASFLISVLDIILRFFLFVGVLLILNVDMTGLATIISSGILAIGFAMQDIIGNFAAGVIILGTKPFLSGNYIEIDGVGGTVREVRMMTTLLVTPNGQDIFVPNKHLTSGKVTNYSVEPFRRGVMKLTFPHDVDFDKIYNIFFPYFFERSESTGTPTPRVGIDSFNELGYSVSMFFYAVSADYWTVLYQTNKDISAMLRENNLTPASRSIVKYYSDKN